MKQMKPTPTTHDGQTTERTERAEPTRDETTQPTETHGNEAKRVGGWEAPPAWASTAEQSDGGGEGVASHPDAKRGQTGAAGGAARCERHSASNQGAAGGEAHRAGGPRERGHSPLRAAAGRPADRTG